MFLGGKQQISAKNLNFEILQKCPLCEIWEYTFKQAQYQIFHCQERYPRQNVKQKNMFIRIADT